MRYEKLKNVPRGEFLKRKPEHKKVYTRGEYDRSFKKYRIDDWDDISRDMLVDGDTLVWVGFTF
tara:strand:- start:169 stop:360 length:192 start_codon:yes stop_codon:yes gene_type:complete